VEFCRLFIGPQPECPPYASAHQGEVKLGGRTAPAVDDFMARHDVRPVIGEHDAVLEHDHLSVELALLAHFYQAAFENGPEGREEAWAAAQELLHHHIWPWADGYLKHVSDAARPGPYRAISSLLWDVLDNSRTWPTHLD
jgi:TorA maturation chaperone TorD